MNLRWYHFAAWGALIAAMLLMPRLVDLGLMGRGTLRTMIQACYLAMFAISWDVLSGRTGYISFGHPFLIGIGAYGTAILSKKFGVPVELSIPLAVLITMIGGLVVLLPALRIKGSYFALVTLAFMELMYQLVQVIRPDLTGGTRGLSGIKTLTRGAENGYMLAVSLMLAVALGCWLLMRTRFGTALWALGQNEEAVSGSGLSTIRLKAMAFLVSAFVAGLAGAFLVHYNGSLAPRAMFDINSVFTIIVAALIGGAGTILGPVLGAFFLTFLLEWLRPFLPGAERFLVYGAVALVLYMYQPKGIYAIIEGGLKRLWGRA
ncbi:Branched-chain amino acid transport system permease protein LivM [Candidatus Rhodobacter oscarellae]|uniref:Branched-chain amino acid transport system permease protein LivM n=1 Tax=Candidatus Rhodobacter oscarellae TaxID=1675527 RepID=A0A0J9E9K6_9RHOB|nr:branched-chain amino acid ABC transporter permease [Candidatus Rhodobacter lobularis]KMW59311.1 Branched-chain amino acid transport system permease protein LivM [Candidatus Rhodobacter lobularis]